MTRSLTWSWNAVRLSYGYCILQRLLAHLIPLWILPLFSSSLPHISHIALVCHSLPHQLFLVASAFASLPLRLPHCLCVCLISLRLLLNLSLSPLHFLLLALKVLYLHLTGLEMLGETSTPSGQIRIGCIAQ